MGSLLLKYTAEYRGGDHGEKPWEWCIIAEDVGPCGSAIVFDLTEGEAKARAKWLNGEVMTYVGLDKVFTRS